MIDSIIMLIYCQWQHNYGQRLAADVRKKKANQKKKNLKKH